MTLAWLDTVHLCLFTDFADLTIETPDGVTRFEFSQRFGPMLLGTRGREIARLPVQRDKFWAALHWWCLQGHRVERGRCVYDVPSAQRLYSPDGKNFVLDTPENRATLAEFVIPGCDTATIEDAWSRKAEKLIVKEPIR